MRPTDRLFVFAAVVLSINILHDTRWGNGKVSYIAYEAMYVKGWLNAFVWAVA